ncbi:MAG: pyridine nucleotide-disulfide oxidoreductase [Alphaproteobacteria bacterium]|nr:MAG: pyridine nucleotide-disulfide oxidoreductase [Alphaproteobacteria bacterium]
MSGRNEHVAVIGGGQAAAALAARLRAGGFEGRITIFGEEPVPPYQRPPLSKKYLLGEVGVDRLLLKPESFYAEQDITLCTGLRVDEIDPAAGTLSAGGERIGWDRLALVTGGVPRRLPEAIGGALPGVHVMRTLADADALAPELRPGRRLVVVGGGYIGLEAAAVAAQRGLRVTVLEAAPRILARVASAETAAEIRALHAAHGVEIREGVSLERLEPGDDGRVARALLAGGEAIGADLVIVGIGIRPADELARAAGIACDNGIAADARGRTSAPGVWAAGDCASFPWRGRRIRLESVQNAIDMAEAVADDMLGRGRDYDPVPWFWSDQYDAKLQIAGLALDHDRVVRRPGTRPGSVSLWYYAGPRLVAVDAINAPREYMTAKRLLEAGRSPDPAAIADPATDLRALLAG